VDCHFPASIHHRSARHMEKSGAALIVLGRGRWRISPVDGPTFARGPRLATDQCDRETAFGAPARAPDILLTGAEKLEFLAMLIAAPQPKRREK
jgi:hypothetical protein